MFSLRDCILDWFSGLQMVAHSRGACLHETGNKAWQRGRTPSVGLSLICNKATVLKRTMIVVVE